MLPVFTLRKKKRKSWKIEKKMRKITPNTEIGNFLGKNWRKVGAKL